MDDELIKEEIKKYDWYQPISFGNNIYAEGSYNKSNVASFDFGINRWNYIISRNIPDIQGMRVLDIGCNSGINSVLLARTGAAEVVGLDSEKYWPNWKEQAYFVKNALEYRCNIKYNIKFIDSEMQKIPELGLGKFDLVLALCCIYYINEHDMLKLFSYFKQQEAIIVLQGNTNKKDQKRETSNQAHPKFIENILIKAGYQLTWIDKPFFYNRPVIVGSNYDYRYVFSGKKDRARNWLRRLI